MTKPLEPRFGSSVNGTDDREACPKSWIALYTRPRSEKKVKAYLDSIKVENYLPLQHQLRQWSDRKKLIEVVVIPMIIFVFVEKDKLFGLINNRLIIRPIYSPDGSAAVIPADQIEQLKFILGQSEYPVSFDPNAFKINDRVRVVRGPLMGLIGDILSSDDDFLDLAVPIGIRGVARLNIEKINVEPL